MHTDSSHSSRDRFALVSVFDKRGVVPFARGVAALGFRLLSTGGTARALREAGLDVTDVSAYTESPEVMGGRVKTLHPRVHGGLLMRDLPEDREALASLGGAPIDLVCVNLYPFEETVASGASRDEAIEQIDIGGPSMLRSAAKNAARVTVVVDPDDYDEVLAALGAPAAAEANVGLRQRLASKVFATTAAYDAAIAAFLSAQTPGASVVPSQIRQPPSPAQDASLGASQAPAMLSAAQSFPAHWTLSLRKVTDLRYGENPHQGAALYAEEPPPAGTLVAASLMDEGGKALSFNNYVDVQAAWDAVMAFANPQGGGIRDAEAWRCAAVVVKHTNPCGVAVGTSLEETFRRARAADALSAFGGIVALNQCVDGGTAAAIAESFVECVVAPGFSDEALALLRAKKQLRLLAMGSDAVGLAPSLSLRPVSGGMLVQRSDAIQAGELANAKVVTSRAPTEQQKRDLFFAWHVCKHVKSNAIVLAREQATVGVGAGQMSRVVSVALAAEKAGEQARGSVMASDAFFPFADGVETAAQAGIVAVIQPGGSKRDEEVIAAADKAGMAMLFTGHRHFLH